MCGHLLFLNCPLQDVTSQVQPADDGRPPQRKVEKTVSFNLQPPEELHFNSSDISDETHSDGAGSEGNGEGGDG